MKDNAEQLHQTFQQSRAQTACLAAPLSPEDQTIQTMPEVSPTKWHLAHTSWFFETFLLKPFLPSYEELNPKYNYLFNSYYEQVGDKWTRAERGLLSRPSVNEVMDYRNYINDHMEKLLETAPAKIWQQVSERTRLGIHHEWQHQELLLTDIKHVLAYNPLHAAAYPRPATSETNSPPASPLDFISFEGGIQTLGAQPPNGAFAFDNETPCHKKLMQDFSLASRLVTNGEYLEFIEEGGYHNPALWLSDGWTEKNQHAWNAPLYWHKNENEGWQESTLFGDIPLNKAQPVIHLSFYEASAFANWAGKRLPLEEELEIASRNQPIKGNLGKLLDENQQAVGVHPKAAPEGSSLRQLYGDGWEWTQSPYTPYPQYRSAKNAIGEYNGKFMCNQFVLKGGSCATPEKQVRSTYRNFFPPNARWQFSALRLADDGAQ